MNKKKLLTLILSIAITLVIINFIASRVGEFVNNVSPSINPPPQVEKTHLESEDVKNTSESYSDQTTEQTEEQGQTIRIAVAKMPILASEIITPDAVMISDIEVQNSQQADDYFVAGEGGVEYLDIFGYKMLRDANAQDPLLRARVNTSQKYDFSKQTELKLSLADSIAFQGETSLSLIHVAPIRSGEIVRVREVMSDIPVRKGQGKFLYIGFTSEQEKDFAEETLSTGGYLDVSLQKTAVERRLSCGTKTCIGSFSQFANLFEKQKSIIDRATDSITGAVENISNASKIKNSESDSSNSDEDN